MKILFNRKSFIEIINLFIIIAIAYTIAEIALETLIGFPRSAPLSRLFCKIKQHAGRTESSNCPKYHGRPE